MISIKPLGIKAYGSIPHFQDSKLGEQDKRIHIDQEYICTRKIRDKNDVIIVTEKLDGSCVSVVKKDGTLIPLIKAGYRASDSNYLQHIIFNDWAYENYRRFHELLNEGERIVGEWMIQAHGTKYIMPHEPFIVFDIFNSKNERILYLDFSRRVQKYDFIIPNLLSYGESISIRSILDRLPNSPHGAIASPEGAVWRVERLGKVDFLAKYVRAGKKDGLYLTGGKGVDVWNSWACNSDELDKYKIK